MLVYPATDLTCSQSCVTARSSRWRVAAINAKINADKSDRGSTENAVEDRERLHMANAERLRRLRRIGDHEVRVRMRQIEREVVDLVLDAANDRQRLPEVGLRVVERMNQTPFRFQSST